MVPPAPLVERSSGRMVSSFETDLYSRKYFRNSLDLDLYDIKLDRFSLEGDLFSLE